MKRNLPPIIRTGNVSLVRLTFDISAKIDPVDEPTVSGHVWRIEWHKGKRVAVATINGKTTPMHRLIAGVGDHVNVRHRNGDKLDNRRSNLIVSRIHDSVEGVRK